MAEDSTSLFCLYHKYRFLRLDNCRKDGRLRRPSAQPGPAGAGLRPEQLQGHVLRPRQREVHLSAHGSPLQIWWPMLTPRVIAAFADWTRQDATTIKTSQRRDTEIHARSLRGKQYYLSPGTERVWAKWKLRRGDDRRTRYSQSSGSCKSCLRVPCRHKKD